MDADIWNGYHNQIHLTEMSTNMAANCDKLWVVISTVYRNKSHELCNKQRCIYVNTDGEEDPPTSMILTP